MEGNTRLTARLSRRYDVRGEDIEMPEAIREDALLAVAIADIYIWHDRFALHEQVEAWVLQSRGLASGAESISSRDVTRLRDVLRQSALGLPDPERQDTLRALGEAVEGFAAGDTSLVFEYSWTTSL